MDFILMLFHQSFCWTTRFFFDIKTQKTSKPKKRIENDKKKSTFFHFSDFRTWRDLSAKSWTPKVTSVEKIADQFDTKNLSKSSSVYVIFTSIFVYFRIILKKLKYIVMICALFANISERIDTHLRDLLVTSYNSLSGCVCENWPMPFSIADTTQDFFVLICMNLDLQNGCCWDAIFQRKYAWHETLCDLQQFLLIC